MLFFVIERSKEQQSMYFQAVLKHFSIFCILCHHFFKFVQFSQFFQFLRKSCQRSRSKFIQLCGEKKLLKILKFFHFLFVTFIKFLTKKNYLRLLFGDRAGKYD